MIRVHVICEGQTEETFVKEVLGPHLTRLGVSLIASLVGKPGHKGGCVTTSRMVGDIKRRLLDDGRAWCTTLFDFYGLDQNFPGRREAMGKGNISEKALAVEDALRAHVMREVGDSVARRFVPYVQMYEFEGLLFSNPVKMATGLCRKDLVSEFSSIRNEFATPEDINDSPATAPSKRIQKLIPGYEKPLYGSLAVIEIGLDEIRRECPLFNQWVEILEKLSH